MHLNESVSRLPGVGPKRAALLGKLGILTLGDFLTFFPRDYEDRSQEKTIFAALDGEKVCVRAIVGSQAVTSMPRRGLTITKVRVFDDTGALEVVFFNQPFVKNQLKLGKEYVFYGKIEARGRAKTMQTPQFEAAEAAGVYTGRILPVYPLSQGITRKIILDGVREALNCSDEFCDFLPLGAEARHKLIDASSAYTAVHFPRSLEEADAARRRFIFEEFFVFCCGARLIKKQNEKDVGCIMKHEAPEEFYSLLKFTPTDAQKRGIGEAFSQMCSGRRMNRLIQGDVGSGKTMVAAACLWLAVKNGFQGTVMAPTELLARQLYETIGALLKPAGMRCECLSSSMPKSEKLKIKQALAAGEVDVLCGTHAILQEDVRFSRLGLFIVDEQHRFGVRQRALLGAKNSEAHTLVMSATPIPRTLTLMIYGDLDVSVIDQLPPGRKPVATYAVSEKLRPRVLKFIAQQIEEGGQAYVVCPLVEDSESLNRKSAQQEAEELQKAFPQWQVGLLHGKMKPADKDAVMRSFVEGKTRVLVATTVVEVGVNVPNATLMVVENADLFGLSQLHQLRGRVGRGLRQSHCILISGDPSEVARRRLNILCETNDGFAIAQEDLKLRGPGDFFGNRQHGLPAFRIANLAEDMELLYMAQEEANSLLERDGELIDPENAQLKQRVSDMLNDQLNALN